jgi:hypothetical protein
LVDIIFRLGYGVWIEVIEYTRLLANRAKAFRKNDDFASGNVVSFDEIADHGFRQSIRIRICSVECVETLIVRSFQELVNGNFIIENPRLPVFVAYEADY